MQIFQRPEPELELFEPPEDLGIWRLFMRHIFKFGMIYAARRPGIVFDLKIRKSTVGTAPKRRVSKLSAVRIDEECVGVARVGQPDNRGPSGLLSL